MNDPKELRQLAKEHGLTPPQLAKIGAPADDGFRIDYYHPITRKKTGMSSKRLDGVIGSGKYRQPSGTLPEAYYCPLLRPDWRRVFAKLETAEKPPVLVTEGGFKAAKACAEGFPCIGLGGVFNFASKAKEVEWLPTLDYFKWTDVRVYLTFDSDAADNWNVRLAETRLALRLVERGAKVYILRLPKKADGTKCGLDDYLIEYGADSLKKLMDEAKPWNKDLPLHKMNTEVVFVEQPLCVVRLKNFLVMETRDFRNDIYANRKHTIAVKKAGVEISREVPTASAWTEWADRNTVNGLTFEPGGPLYIDATQKGRLLNTWPGWGVEPQKGDVTPYTKLHTRLFGNLPAAEQKWVRQWCAYPFQNLGAKLHSAMMVVGAPGTGKTMLGLYLQTLYGEAGVLITQRELETDFNGWIANRMFVVGDEVMTKENKRNLCELMKAWITSATVPVNKKHVERYQQPNKANFYLTSNHDDALQIEDNDRRYFVHAVTAPVMIAEEGRYFGTWIEDPKNQSALMYHLLYEVDCTGFQPKHDPPVTEAKRDMQAATRTSLDSALLALKENPDDPEILHPGYRMSEKVQGREARIPEKATPRQVGRILFGDACPYKPETIGCRLRHLGFEGKTEKVDVGKTARLYKLRFTVTETANNIIKKTKNSNKGQHPTVTANRNLGRP